MEQLTFSLFDYFSSSTRDAEPFVNEPAKADTSTGKKLYVYDCGEELHGARKHQALATKFSIEWQKVIEEDPSQAFELVCKNELLADFKPVQLGEEGFTSEAAYAIKLIWDRVCQRPEDDPKQRAYFIQAVSELQARVAQARTEELIRAAIDDLKEDIWKACYSTYSHKVKAEPELMEYRFWLSLGDRFRSIFIGKGRTPAGYHKILSRAFRSEDGKDWRWAVSKIREGTASRRENADRWERKVPEEVIRLSQELSGVKKPEDLIDIYSFRGVQFGNWVQDAAGRYHVLCCGNALADLATILNLPRQAVSLYGSLGIAFGARGSGAALAHFEPSTNVMNIT